MKHCGIYQIKNEITGKIYIGQSVDINRRWTEHKNRAHDLNCNCYNKPLYLSMRKYGLEVFTLTIIEECSPEKLNEREAYYIQLYNSITPNGYNILESSDKQFNHIDTCKECGKVISKTAQHGLCRECYCRSTRKCEHPSKDELYELLCKNNFCAVGRMYNVDSNAVRKWCKQYNLPYHAKDYK